MMTWTTAKCLPRTPGRCAGVAALAILEVSKGDATAHQGDEHLFPLALPMSNPIYSYSCTQPDLAAPEIAEEGKVKTER